MYLLYLDESGTHSSARHFVLAGASLYETNIRWATDQMDRLQTQYFPDVDGNVLFHAAPLRVREGESVSPPFDQLDRTSRLELLNQLYDLSLIHI